MREFDLVVIVRPVGGVTRHSLLFPAFAVTIVGSLFAHKMSAVLPKIAFLTLLSAKFFLPKIESSQEVFFQAVLSVKTMLLS